MSWLVVPCLLEGRDQMNARFPNRSKSSDGTIGDTSHKASASSHNPDRTSNPEHADGDSLDEVRAIDFTTNLNDDAGVTMEQVVQKWIETLRNGGMWWVRYVIFNGRIWHRRDNFVTRTYTGSDKHTGHVHVTSDFTQDADSVTGTDWCLGVVVAGHDSPQPQSGPDKLVVDGEMGPKTIRRWQEVMGTPADGVIDDPSMLVEAVQRHLNARGYKLIVDGRGIWQNGKKYKTVRALQDYLGTTQDGSMSVPVSELVEAIQNRLNENYF